MLRLIKANYNIVSFQCHNVITFCPWTDSLSLFFGNFVLPLARRPAEAKSVFRCQMAKMKLDFRTWQGDGEKVETISGEKSGTGLKIDQKYNVSFNIPSR